MNKARRTYCNLALLLFTAYSANATSGATNGAKDIPARNLNVVQSSTGDCTTNIGEVSGKVQVTTSCNKYYVKNLNSKAKLNVLEIHQDQLMLAQHPTELRISRAYLRPWLGDFGRASLTLQFENPRDIPIPEIEIDLLDPKSGSSIPALKPRPLTQSSTYREIGSHKFGLLAGGKTDLPVAFLDEVTNPQYLEAGKCAFDAALTLDRPSDLPSEISPGHQSFSYDALLVRARYKTIFGQEVSSTRWIWIVYGQGSEGQKFWYPSETRWNTLTCIK